MPSGALRPQSRSLASYSILKARVRETLLHGRRKIEEAKVLTYWNTGRYIRIHIRLNGDTAEYAKRVLEDLGRDMDLDVSVLRRMAQFYDAFSSRAGRRVLRLGLNWSHFRILITIEEEKTRMALAYRAAREEWVSERLEEELARLRKRGLIEEKLSPSSRTPQLLVPIKGRVGIYRIVEIGDKLNWDKGFASYRELSGAEARGLKAGDFVRRKEPGKFKKIPDAKASDLYTYDAELFRAIDADTFWMKVSLAPPDWRREKLRLRGIDAPELNTPRGRAAKRFVEALFKKAKKITVTTTKPDKYHRYLSDVFLKMPEGEEIFLNTHLLETGHAVPTDHIPPSEWDKE